MILNLEQQLVENIRLIAYLDGLDNILKSKEASKTIIQDNGISASRDLQEILVQDSSALQILKNLASKSLEAQVISSLAAEDDYNYLAKSLGRVTLMKKDDLLADLKESGLKGLARMSVEQLRLLLLHQKLTAIASPQNQDAATNGNTVIASTPSEQQCISITSTSHEYEAATPGSITRENASGNITVTKDIPSSPSSLPVLGKRKDSQAAETAPNSNQRHKKMKAEAKRLASTARWTQLGQAKSKRISAQKRVQEAEELLDALNDTEAAREKDLTNETAIDDEEDDKDMTTEESLQQKAQQDKREKDNISIKKKLETLRLYATALSQKATHQQAQTIAAQLEKVSERTIRRWLKQYKDTNYQYFEASLKGRYPKFASKIQDRAFRAAAREFVRESMTNRKCQLTVEKFKNWCITTMKKDNDLDKTEICWDTARRWLHQLGFNVFKRGHNAYVDGHERPDVIAVRKAFVKRMQELRSQNLVLQDMPTPEEIEDIKKREVKDKPYFVIYHDESVARSNEVHGLYWADPREPGVAIPKGGGKGVMVSAFVCSALGFLEQYTVAFEIGQGKYFTAELFEQQIKDMTEGVAAQFPWARILIIVDNATIHKRFANDALNPRVLNVRPGGAQPIQRDGWYVNAAGEEVQQQMYFVTDGPPIAKGMQQILTERSLHKPKMRKEEMVQMLSQQPDFSSQLTLVQEIANSHGLELIYLPKFHAELSPIELCWATLKQRLRSNPTFTGKGFIDKVLSQLYLITQQDVKRCCDHVSAWEEAYHLDPTLSHADAKAKVYQARKTRRSHRRMWTTVERLQNEHEESAAEEEAEQQQMEEEEDDDDVNNMLNDEIEFLNARMQDAD